MLLEISSRQPITADFDNHVSVQSKIGCLITDTLSIPAGHSPWVKGAILSEFDVS